ncbi:MAG: AAA family ATPase [Clostridia bacterium]|nr:AAA family ATPase [Clostridia bacterium]
MKYMSKDMLIKKASKKIVPLETQKETLNLLASIISIHLRKLCAIESGIDTDALPNTSLLLLARTGCGKSHLIKTLADAASLNVFTIDSSALSPEGYKGTTLSQLFVSAKNSCKNEEKFDSSIVIIDEFCKMQFRPNEATNAQFNLLQVIEGKGISCDIGQSKTSFIDTSKMLFIFAGAFDGLEEQIKLRIKGKSSIGFVNSTALPDENEYLKYATMEDIKKYGFNSELLGRIGSIHYIPPLTKEDYRLMLQSPKASYLEKYSHLYKLSDVTLTIDDSACEKIAEMATTLNTGARAVSTVLQNVLNPTFSTIDNDPSISKVTLTVKNNEIFPKYTHSKRKTHNSDLTNILKVYGLSEKNDFFFPYIETQADAYDFVRYLIGFAGNISPEDEIQLFFFLQTCLQYIMEYRPMIDYELQSFSKLANTLDEEPSGNGTTTSVFDRIMKDCTNRTTDKESYTFKDYYELFKKIKTPDCGKSIKKHITTIRKRYTPYDEAEHTA